MECKHCRHELKDRDGYATNAEKTVWYCPKCSKQNDIEGQAACEHSKLNEWLEIYGPEIVEIVCAIEDNAVARGTMPYGYAEKLRTKSRKNWEKLVKLLGRENF